MKNAGQRETLTGRGDAKFDGNGIARQIIRKPLQRKGFRDRLVT
jgi:hypothetical protein